VRATSNRLRATQARAKNSKKQLCLFCLLQSIWQLNGHACADHGLMGGPEQIIKRVNALGEGPKLAIRGGGRVNGSRSKFLSKLIRRPISQNHHEPSRVLGEVWNSYGRAKPTQNTPRTCERKHGSERENLQTWQTRIGQTALSDRSDRFQRPVRPVSPRQIANKASNGKSRAN